MTGVRNLPSPGSYREADDAMARMTLEQIKARHPAVDRRKLEATTEEDIARHMVEDGEMPPAPGSAGKQMKR